MSNRNAGEGALILSVDDSDAAHYLRAHALERAGFEVREARSGEDALMAAQVEPIPDLIIVDICLPGIDGLEVCRKLKAEPLTERVPVLLVSAFGNADADYVAFVEASADAYLREPIEPAVLVAMARTLLRGAETHRQCVAAEAQLRAALHAAHLGTWELDVPTGMVKVAGSTPGLFGIGAGDQQRPLSDYVERIHPADRDFVVSEIYGALQTESVYAAEYRTVPHPDDTRWLLARGEIVRDSAGQAQRLIGAIIDVTEQRNAQAALRQSQQRLTLAQKAGKVGVFDWNLESERIVWTAELEQIFGLEPGSFEGTYEAWENFAVADEGEDGVSFLKSWLTSDGDDGAWEYRFRRVDGENRWAAVRARKIFDELGKPARVIGTHIDITERKRTEQELRDIASALRESEAQQRQIADSMPQLVWVTRADGYHEYYNQRWFEYTGLTFEDTKGAGWNQVFHPDDRPRAWEVWRECLRTGRSYAIEYRCRRYDGEYRWFLGRAEPIRDNDGNIVRWFGTCTDIHDQKVALDELRRANEDLQQFAYAASHDLQEPLRMVTSYTQLLMRKQGSMAQEELDRYLQYIVDGAERMETLLTDLRSYWKAGAASVDQRTPVNTAQLIEEVLMNLQSVVEESGATVVVDPDMPTILTDRTALVQVFQNLISNGVKYRHEERVPKVVISADRSGDECIFHVRDNGVGIPPEHFDKLFRVFSRLHGRKYQGTGLGLAICQKIIERLGGRIWVRSECGEGSEFSFSVPAAAVDWQGA